MRSPLDARAARTVTGGPAFAFSQRVLRAGFMLWWMLFCRWTPPQMHRWRVLSLRLFGAKVDWRAQIYGSTRVWFPPNLSMGPHAVLGPRVRCYNMAPVRIEAFAIISQDAELCAGTHDIDDFHNQLITRPISISPHAWVAAGAFVGPGVQIGEGAVLGARAVAMSALEPWTVYVGNPVQKLRRRQRFDRSTLLENP